MPADFFVNASNTAINGILILLVVMYKKIKAKMCQSFDNLLFLCFFIKTEYVNFMQRNQIKSFICSFLLSLLAVGAVAGGLYGVSASSNKKAQKQALKIQNISLFKQNIETSEPLKIQANAETMDFSAIEELATPTPEPQNAPEILSEVPAGESILPIENKQEFDLATAEEIGFEELGILERNGVSGTITIAEKTKVEPETASKGESLIVYQPDDEASAEKVLASLDIPQTLEMAEVNSEESLIPLEEGKDVLYSDISVGNSVRGSQIAMLEPDDLVQTMENLDTISEKAIDEVNLKKNEWQHISYTEEDNPWIVARGNKYAKNQAIVEKYADEDKEETVEPSAEEIEDQPKEELEAQEVDRQTPEVVETQAEQEELSEETDKEALSEVHAMINPQPLLRPIENNTKYAYQMIENLLIPIPEDIKNDANLTPNLSVTPQDAKQKDNTESVSMPTMVPNAAPKEAAALNDNEKQSGLFKSIASWFKSEPQQTKIPEQPKKEDKKKKSTKKKKGLSFFQSTEEETEAPVIMPAELRLSFQPNRAEISGQTLSWIHAFADNARDNDGVYVEVRIDGTSSFALQQKRLNLLSTILAKRGVDYRKINIVFTSREPNSFIIRNIRFSNEEEVIDPKNNTYYQPW